MLKPTLIFPAIAAIILGACNSSPQQSISQSKEPPIQLCAQAEREIVLLESKLPELSRLPARSSSSSALPPWMAQDSRNLNELRRRAISLDEEQKIRRRIEALKKECDIP